MKGSKEYKMKEIKIGDVVKKTIRPQAWVLVLAKEKLQYGDTGEWINHYTVLNPDGSKGYYTDKALKKMPDVYY